MLRGIFSGGRRAFQEYVYYCTVVDSELPLVPHFPLLIKIVDFAEMAEDEQSRIQEDHIIRKSRKWCLSNVDVTKESVLH